MTTLTMVNREVCSLKDFFVWVKRLLLATRLYHPGWGAVLIHGLVTATIRNPRSRYKKLPLVVDYVVNIPAIKLHFTNQLILFKFFIVFLLSLGTVWKYLTLTEIGRAHV